MTVSEFRLSYVNVYFTSSLHLLKLFGICMILGYLQAKKYILRLAALFKNRINWP